jgi:hypothetical protein
VLATLSRWRPWVQIPSGALTCWRTTARYANWQSGQAQTLAICGFDSLSCHLDLFERVVFLTAVCKAVAIKL